MSPGSFPCIWRCIFFCIGDFLILIFENFFLISSEYMQKTDITQTFMQMAGIAICDAISEPYHHKPTFFRHSGNANELYVYPGIGDMSLNTRHTF
jgi:hypothetical protein